MHFSYCIPYTLSRLNTLLSTIRGREYVEVETLCRSVGNIKVPLVTITERDRDNRENKRKKLILITSRVHPGETNGSLVAEGVIKYLCSDDSVVKKVRREFVFKIVPMINPDGVIAGNFRTGMLGIDLNRVYDQDSKCFPEILSIKRLIKSLDKRYGRPIDFYIDLHGHSTKKNVFLYGPEHPMNSGGYSECRLLAKHLSNLTPMFRYFSCSWRISEGKETTARAVLFRRLNISNCYTMESSNGLYFDRITGDERHFVEKDWIKMGKFVCQGLH